MRAGMESTTEKKAGTVVRGPSPCAWMLRDPGASALDYGCEIVQSKAEGLKEEA